VADLPYDTALQDGWAAQVAALDWQAWRRGRVQLGWVATGACPRCGHRLAIYRRRVLGALPDDEEAMVRAECNCVERHPSRPEGRTQGCGQAAQIPLSRWSGRR
jgi:hypothetical protein